MQYLSKELAVAQVMETVSYQTMYDTLTADGYDIPFSLENASQRELNQLYREYKDYRFA
jgi:hypothetical protein